MSSGRRLSHTPCTHRASFLCESSGGGWGVTSGKRLFHIHCIHRSPPHRASHLCGFYNGWWGKTAGRKIFHILCSHRVSLLYEICGVRWDMTCGRRFCHILNIYEASLQQELSQVWRGLSSGRAFITTAVSSRFLFCVISHTFVETTLPEAIALFIAAIGFLISVESRMCNKLWLAGKAFPTFGTFVVFLITVGSPINVKGLVTAKSFSTLVAFMGCTPECGVSSLE